MKITVICQVFLLSLIFGCASPSDEDFFFDEVVKDEELRTHMQEWQQLKPEIHELVKMKQELKVLLAELDDLASVTESNLHSSSVNSQKSTSSQAENIAPPKKPEITQKVVILDPPLSTASAPIATPTALPKAQVTPLPLPKAIKNEVNDAENNFTVQLGSFSNIYTVKQIWLTLKQKHASIFQNKVGLSESVTLSNKGTLHRLKVGYFSSKEQAQSTCELLKKEKQNCITSNKAGKALL